MKKLIILLTLVFLITGCSVYKASDDIDTLMNDILSSNLKLSNQNFQGYKFYLPENVRLKDKNGYNFTLLYNKKNMYMYVDVVAYHHKVVDMSSASKDSYYYRDLSYGDKFGYITIKAQDDDNYLIEMNYNYAIIEAYSNKKDLSNTVRTITYILNSFKYNDKVISSLIGENKISYEEEEFNLYKKEEKGNYLEASKKEDDDNSNELVDDDNIEIDSEEFGS